MAFWSHRALLSLGSDTGSVLGGAGARGEQRWGGRRSSARSRGAAGAGSCGRPPRGWVFHSLPGPEFLNPVPVFLTRSALLLPATARPQRGGEASVTVSRLGGGAGGCGSPPGSKNKVVLGKTCPFRAALVVGAGKQKSNIKCTKICKKVQKVREFLVATLGTFQRAASHLFTGRL